MDLDAKNNEKQHEEIRNKENIFVKLNEKNQTCLDFLIARKCLMNMKYKIQNSFLYFLRSFDWPFNEICIFAKHLSPLTKPVAVKDG